MRILTILTDHLDMKVTNLCCILIPRSGCCTLSFIYNNIFINTACEYPSDDYLVA
jgi:hypothetical protein